MIKGEITKERMEGWKYNSPDTEGLHEVIKPGRDDCEVISVYRLNISAGNEFTLESGKQEMDVVCVKGRLSFEAASGELKGDCGKLDSFYMVSGMQVKLTASEDSVLYIGAAVDEGFGKPYFRKYDAELPIGDIRQVHGQGVGRRDVFMTLDPGTPSSRILAGETWGGNGAWTSWPPHQHEKDLEEVYCYFDMDEPDFGMHLSYVKSGDIDNIVVHTVKSGTMILAPRGYHPTVASPGVRNTYVWFLGAHSHVSRRYDLAVLDPARADKN